MSNIPTLFLTCAFLVASPAHSAVLIDEKFDYATYADFDAVWDLSCAGPNSTLYPDNAFSVSPTRSLRSHFDGVLTADKDLAHTCFGYLFFPASTRIFYRWYTRFSPGFLPDAPGLTTQTGSKQMYLKSNAGDLVFWLIYPNENRLIAQYIPAANAENFQFYCAAFDKMDSGCNLYPNGPSINILDAQTHCIETEVDMGTPGTQTGSLRIWIDGTKTHDYSNLWIAKNPASQYTALTHYAQNGYGDRWIDDLVVSTTRVGCGNAPVDSTAPGAPQGLRLL